MLGGFALLVLLLGLATMDLYTAAMRSQEIVLSTYVAPECAIESSASSFSPNLAKSGHSMLCIKGISDHHDT